MMNRTCSLCLYTVFFLVGLFGLVFGGLGALTVGLFGAIPGSGLPPAFPLLIGIIFGFGGFYMLMTTIRKGSLMKRVVAVASSFEKITIDEISRQSGVKLPQIRPLLYEAISERLIHGTVKENTFIREKVTPGEKITIEREVMVSRKVPEACYKCGASLNPQEVEWVGPDSIRCPHCGSTMAIEVERM